MSYDIKIPDLLKKLSITNDKIGKTEIARNYTSVQEDSIIYKLSILKLLNDSFSTQKNEVDKLQIILAATQLCKDISVLLENTDLTLPEKKVGLFKKIVQYVIGKAKEVKTDVITPVLPPLKEPSNLNFEGGICAGEGCFYKNDEFTKNFDKIAFNNISKINLLSLESESNTITMEELRKFIYTNKGLGYKVFVVVNPNTKDIIYNLYNTFSNDFNTHTTYRLEQINNIQNVYGFTITLKNPITLLTFKENKNLSELSIILQEQCQTDLSKITSIDHTLLSNNMQQLLTDLQKLHENDIIHLDIKLQNIMDCTNNFRFIDFAAGKFNTDIDNFITTLHISDGRLDVTKEQIKAFLKNPIENLELSKIIFKLTDVFCLLIVYFQLLKINLDEILINNKILLQKAYNKLEELINNNNYSYYINVLNQFKNYIDSLVPPNTQKNGGKSKKLSRHLIMSTTGRIVKFYVPDTLQSKINKESIDEMVLYHQKNRGDLEYSDYVRFLDILADMDELITDSSIVKEQEESVSDPEQRKLYARIIVLHNLTLLLQKTIEKMKAKEMTGGRQALSYSSIHEENNMNRILNADGLINELTQLNDSREMPDMNTPDPFSSSSPSNGVEVHSGLQDSIYPIRGGARSCKKRMNKKYKGGEGEITHSDLQANREINRMLNTSYLVNDLTKLNKTRPYTDTSFPDPFSASSFSSKTISSNLTNTIFPQLGGKKKKQTPK